MTASDSTPPYDSDTEPESVAEAEQILDQIRTQQQSAWEETPTERQQELSRLRKRTLTDLDDPKQVIPELLQNADDVGGDCTKVTISLTNEALVFQNHEEPMAAKNVAALGEFTKSTKNSLSYIGHFGIGFKTVFSVTNTPQIRSGYFSFQYTQDNPETPTPNYEDDFEAFNGTEIRLPFADGIPEQKLTELRKQLESIHRLLPYLNNLEEIHVTVHDSERLLKRTVTENGRHIVREKDQDEDEWNVLKRFRVFSEQYSPEGEMLEQLATERNIKPENLSSVKSNLSIKVAIPVDNDGRPTDWQTEDEQSRLFCYFPTEERTALPFDIQADFLLKPDRQKIRPNHPLNERLLQQAGVALEKAFIAFHREQVDPEAILHLLPDPSEDRPSHLNTLIESILATVESESCIPDPRGNLHRPEELLVIPQGLQRVLPFDAVIQAFETTDAETYPSLDLPTEVRTRLRQFDGPHTVGMEDILTKLQTADFLYEQSPATLIEFMAEIQRYLDTEFSYPSGDERKRKERIEDAVKQLPILPLQDGRQCSVAGPTTAIHKPPGQSEETYARFHDQLNLLSTDLLQELSQPEDTTEDAARKAEELLSGVLEVDELSDRDIVRDVINPAFESPDATDDSVLDTYITFISERSSLSSTQAIKLKGEDGAYHDPDSLYLSSAYVSKYTPEPVFEEVTERTPVSVHYLDLNDQPTGEWRSFLTEIGVKDHLDVPTHKANYISFETKDDIQTFLKQQGDDGTEVYSDETLDPYNGRRNYRWLRGNRHGLTDYQFEESVLSHLQDLLNSNQSSSFWTAFARMIDAHWESTYSDAAYRDYCYSQQSNRYEVHERQSRCPSSFGVFLRENAWLPDEDNKFHRPAHLFERNPSTEGAPVNFLGVTLTNDDLRQFLNIQTHPGIRHTCIQIEQLAEKRTEEDPDKLEKEILTQLYSLADELEGASDETRSDVIDRLQDCRFIRVRNADPEFRTPQEVTWTDDIGDFFVAIGEDYHPLESLFVDVLDVPIEASLDDCLTVLAEAEAVDDWDAIETAWKDIMRAIYKPADFNRTLDELRQPLEETGYLPSASKKLIPYDEIEYVATTPRTAEGLPEDVADSVLSPYYDNRWNRDDAVDNIKTTINVSPLEEALENRVQSPSFDPTTALIYEDFPAVFDVAYSVLLETEQQSAASELSELAQFSLQRPTEIRCDYYLDGQCVIAAHSEDHYIDSEQEHVLLIEDDTAAINLAERIASYLELPERVHSRITRLVKGAVGKQRSLLKAYLSDEEITFKPLETALDDTKHSENPQQEPQPPLDDSPDNEQDEDPKIPESEPTRDPQNNQSEPQPGDKTEPHSSKPAVISNAKSQQPESPPPSQPTAKPQSDITTDEAENDPLVAPSQSIESASKPTSAQSPQTDSQQKPPNTDTRKPTPRYNGGGGGQRSNEVGDAGEQFVFDQLVDTLKTQFDTISEVNETTKKTEIVGQRANEQYTTTIYDVSHESGRGYDIHVAGAEIEQSTDELQVASIGADLTTLVEVKSTENTGRKFGMTFSEYKKYCQQQEDYAVVRVVNALDSPTITAIIGTLPDIWNKRHKDLLIRPQGVTVERD